MELQAIVFILAHFLTIATFTRCAQIPSIKRSATIFTKEPTVRIQCLSGSMLITIKDAPANLNGQFSGMVYPKGLAKNSTCLTEYRDQEGPLRYKLPLKSCNTMPIETHHQLLVVPMTKYHFFGGFNIIL
ncbi:uncharacterized protein LOC134209342 [Armigeres subalbatus]|uniref:uncharacterized protein LOC134209342 n=1 Tax=Armigeres subalbatus TaxID=124917 RepID=UPI002ED61984